MGFVESDQAAVLIPLSADEERIQSFAGEILFVEVCFSNHRALETVAMEAVGEDIFEDGASNLGGKPEDVWFLLLHSGDFNDIRPCFELRW